MPKAEPAFYAVAVGRKPGIYNTKEESDAQLKGYPGSKYKKFHTKEEARGWLVQNGVLAGPAPQPVASTSAAVVPVAEESQRPAPYPESAPSKGKGKAGASSESLLGKNVVVDTQGWQIVYSDGACRGNGQRNPVAGIGVWWGPDDPRNIAERCPGEQTNNRAELIAIVRVLETLPKDKIPTIIKSDSSYAIRCIQDWLRGWRKNGFKNSSGKPVANLGIILYLDALIQECFQSGQKINLEYVKGHNGDPGNDGADFQANRGCELPPVPDRDWMALEKEVLARMKGVGAAYQASTVLAPSSSPPPPSTPPNMAVAPSVVSPFRPAYGAPQSVGRTTDHRHHDVGVQTLPWVHPDGLVPQNPSIARPPTAPDISEDDMNAYAACLASDADLEAELADS